MKTNFAAVFTLGVLCTVLAVPRPDKKEEVEMIPLEKNPYGDQPIIDTGVGGWGSPFSNPFDGFLNSFESFMTRMRQQMETLLKTLPGKSENSSEVPDFGLPHMPFGDIDLSKGNTTSVTKVIDGHKVVINETEYKKEDDLGGTFFKVRIIDVKPDSAEATTAKDTEEVTTATSQEVNKDREPLENSVENEITKSREVVPRFDNIETFDEVDNTEAVGKTDKSETEWQNIQPVEILENNAISDQTLKPIDMSRDIYVNELLAEKGAPVNPDAEILFVPKDAKNRAYYEKFIDPR